MRSNRLGDEGRRNWHLLEKYFICKIDIISKLGVEFIENFAIIVKSVEFSLGTLKTVDS